MPGKKGKGHLIVLLSIIGFFIMGFIFNQFHGGGIVFLSIFAIALIAFAVYMLYWSIQMRSKAKDEKSEKNKEYKASISGTIQHFCQRRLDLTQKRRGEMTQTPISLPPISLPPGCPPVVSA